MYYKNLKYNLGFTIGDMTIVGRDMNSDIVWT